MKHFKRVLQLVPLLGEKSFFLLGPRATGKTSLIREQLKEQAVIIDLLNSRLFLRLSTSPWELEGIIEAASLNQLKKIVVIDEIQKVPALLDEVHRLIEERGWRFLLTGSSARKIKDGQANLLAGRARVAHLFPLTASEISDFNLTRYLRYGGLPSVYPSENPEEDLSAYVETYLYEEIKAEGLVRKLPAFSRFLETAALSNGNLLNFAKISNDAQVAPSTIREHYQILEDTLIGFSLPAWHKSKKRKAVSTAKFYFFDLGVAHTLAQIQSIDRNSDLYGRSFEHWVGLELRAFLAYNRCKQKLSYWRSKHGQEVDFLIGDQTAIEVKASKKVSKRDLNGLLALKEEGVFENFVLVSHDEIETIIEGVRCIHWKSFLKELREGKSWFGKNK